jgi:hypothetical protein
VSFLAYMFFYENESTGLLYVCNKCSVSKINWLNRHSSHGTARLNIADIRISHWTRSWVNTILKTCFLNIIPNSILNISLGFPTGHFEDLSLRDLYILLCLHMIFCHKPSEKEISAFSVLSDLHKSRILSLCSFCCHDFLPYFVFHKSTMFFNICKLYFP